MPFLLATAVGPLTYRLVSDVLEQRARRLSTEQVQVYLQDHQNVFEEIRALPEVNEFQATANRVEPFRLNFQLNAADLNAHLAVHRMLKDLDLQRFDPVWEVELEVPPPPGRVVIFPETLKGPGKGVYMRGSLTAIISGLFAGLTFIGGIYYFSKTKPKNPANPTNALSKS